MITGITIENFKGFGKPQRIPIAPLTLIFGMTAYGLVDELQI